MYRLTHTYIYIHTCVSSASIWCQYKVQAYASWDVQEAACLTCSQCFSLNHIWDLNTKQTNKQTILCTNIRVAYMLFLWRLLAAEQQSQRGGNSLLSSSPHEKLYKYSLYRSHSNAGAINLPLPYLRVLSQATTALRNVNLSHMDVIKERREISG